MKWIKKWFLDGWITEGKQIASPPGMIKYFATCTQCHRVFPHWNASMTVKEAKKRKYLGCKCGGMRIQPMIIPQWKSVWWFVVRGWLVRKVIFDCRLWDPRMPVLENDFS